MALYKLRDDSRDGNVLCIDEEQRRVAAIFDRANEARVQLEVLIIATISFVQYQFTSSFQLAIGVRTFKRLYEIEENISVCAIFATR